MATLYHYVIPCLSVKLKTSKIPCYIDVLQIGAGGGTRTRTTFYSPRILSPVRLPFRHTGCVPFTLIGKPVQVKCEFGRYVLWFLPTLKKNNSVFGRSTFGNFKLPAVCALF